MNLDDAGGVRYGDGPNLDDDDNGGGNHNWVKLLIFVIILLFLACVFSHGFGHF